MKKQMKIEELMENASQGPFSVEGDMIVAPEGGMIAETFSDSGFNAEQEKANAALIEHWLNNGPKLLEALNAMYFLAKQYYGVLDADVLNAKKVIKAASTVEVSE